MLTPKQKATKKALKLHWSEIDIDEDTQRLFIKFLKEHKAYKKFLDSQDGTYSDVLRAKHMLVNSFYFVDEEIKYWRDLDELWNKCLADDNTEEHY